MFHLLARVSFFRVFTGITYRGASCHCRRALLTASEVIMELEVSDGAISRWPNAAPLLKLAEGQTVHLVLLCGIV